MKGFAFKRKPRPGISLLLAAFLVSFVSHAWSKSDFAAVQVVDPYLNMHTGPGRGYPMFYVVEQGDEIEILKRKTDWFKIRTNHKYRPKTGWVHIEHMTHTLTPTGGWAVFPNAGRDDWLQRRLEGGVSGGSFGGANLITGYMNFAFTQNISVQANGSQILGDFSDGIMGTLNVIHRPFPNWRLSPYMTLGAGILHVEPHSTLVQASDRTDEIVNAGAGASLYLTRRFLLKGEYRYNVVLTSRDDNEEIHEWTVGFSVFF